MISTKLTILAKSLVYTDYFSVFILYKQKRFKIVAKKNESNRICVFAYLLGKENMVEILHETDLPYLTRDYYSDGKTNDEICEMLKERVKQAEEFIMAIY